MVTIRPAEETPPHQLLIFKYQVLNCLDKLIWQIEENPAKKKRLLLMMQSAPLKYPKMTCVAPFFVLECLSSHFICNLPDQESYIKPTIFLGIILFAILFSLS